MPPQGASWQGGRRSSLRVGCREVTGQAAAAQLGGSRSVVFLLRLREFTGSFCLSISFAEKHSGYKVDFFLNGV